MVTYFYFGSTPQTRYSEATTAEDAYRLIGANTVAGFEATVFTHDAADRQLTTPDGAPLVVVTLAGCLGVISAVALVGRH
ncbi:hypothetical protein [Streptomyces sp. NPDC012508]|uniref:hypothetical protein n=1 Tax=Streptomyces sp. NPDC012508 TaxID=3364837 RepID=UPI0036A707C4